MTTTQSITPNAASNGIGGNQSRRPSPLDLALAIIPNVFVLARHLGWPIESDGQTFAWWRGNTDTPALSISEGGTRWFDHATRYGGGPIQLLSAVESIEDRRQACRRFMEIAWAIQKTMPLAAKIAAQETAAFEQRSQGHDAPGAREAGKLEIRDQWPDLIAFLRPSDDQLAAIVRSRRWPECSIRGLYHAATRGHLFTTPVGTYVVTDSARFAAKERRIDGRPIAGQSKAKCLPGSENSWPLGAADIRIGDHVILVEGETDQLAILALISMFDPRALGRTTVISLSASAPIDAVAVDIVRERAEGITIIGDADEAGRSAAESWRSQLGEVGVSATVADVSTVAAVKDISDLLTLQTTNPELQEPVGAWITKLTSQNHR